VWEGPKGFSLTTLKAMWVWMQCQSRAANEAFTGNRAALESTAFCFFFLERTHYMDHYYLDAQVKILLLAKISYSVERQKTGITKYASSVICHAGSAILQSACVLCHWLLVPGTVVRPTTAVGQCESKKQTSTTSHHTRLISFTNRQALQHARL
jgi:hypothetical protein